MNFSNDLLLAQINNAVPYISSIPLLLTATTPTIYRIILSVGKHNVHRNYDPTNFYIAGMMKVVSFIVTYAIPCLLLCRNNSKTDNILHYDGIDAVFTAVLWHPLTIFLSHWPVLLRLFDHRRTKPSKSTIRHARLHLLIDGGPFGYGCSKIIQVVVACILWKLVRGILPPTIVDTFGVLQMSMRSLQELTNTVNGIHAAIAVVALTCVSWVVTVVLSLWLKYTNNKGDSHTGLNKMLQPTYGRPLHARESIQLAILAIMNAVCEECTSRGFWRHELELTAGCTKCESNFIQAVIFGLWHYFGIPNGWTGVALTTLYGWIMGYLSDWTVTQNTSNDGSGHFSTGLLFPIITHSIADYYIFTVLARQPATQHTKI